MKVKDLITQLRLLDENLDVLHETNSSYTRSRKYIFKKAFVSVIDDKFVVISDSAKKHDAGILIDGLFQGLK